MQYLCNAHGLERFYPSDPARRAMIDSAMFYLIGTLYPLARLGLARAKALAGDTTGARRYYEEFLSRWANADPDLTAVAEARRELARLQ